MKRAPLDPTGERVRTTDTTPKLNGARLVSKEGAGHYLGASKQTIERLIWAGKLPVVKLPVAFVNNRVKDGASRRVLIDVKDLDALIERSKETMR